MIDKALGGISGKDPDGPAANFPFPFVFGGMLGCRRKVVKSLGMRFLFFEDERVMRVAKND